MLSKVKVSYSPVCFISNRALRSSQLFYSKPYFLFSEDNKKETKQTDKETDQLTQKESQNQYNYDPVRFNRINDPEYLKTLEKLEQQRKKEMRRKPTKSYVVPILACLTSLFIYYLWQTIPYSVIWKSAAALIALSNTFTIY